MNPSNQAPLDYLNQIAPKQQKKSPVGNKLGLALIGVVGIIIVVAAIAGISNAITASNKEPWQKLSLRLKGTQTIVDDSAKKLKNSQLRSTNSDLKLYLSNTVRDIEAPLKSLKITDASTPKSIVSAEETTELTARLEEARLNAKFDSAYAREMAYRLASIQSLYKQILGSSLSDTTKEAVTKAANNIAPLQTTLANFNAETE